MIKGRVSHGWVIVSAAFLLLIGAFGTQMCFGLFLKPLGEEFAWSRAVVSGAMSLLMGVSGLMGVLMGKVTDKYGARAALAPGVVIGTVSYVLASQMHALWEFYLYFGVGGGILAGCAYTPAVTTVSNWFGATRRTMAIGVALLGIIVGQMILSPVISGVIEGRGWRDAWVVLGIVTFVCGLPALVLMRRAPVTAGGTTAGATTGGVTARPPTEGLSTRAASRTLAFWILMLAGAALGLGFYAFTAHVVPYATDARVSTTAAALILTANSFGAAVGTLAAGAITVRLGYRWTLVLLTLLNGIVMFLFIAAENTLAYYLLGAVLGFAFGAVVPARMAVVPPFFGLRSIGTIIGLASLAFSAGAIAGPFLAGYVFDTTGSYHSAFLVFGILLMIGALALCFLRSPRASTATGRSPIWRPGDGLE